MTSDKIISGKTGEDLAADYLKNKGYRIIARNVRTKYGEIDLVAVDGDTTVFIEVKNRSNFLFGRPEEAVNHKKLIKIGKVAINFVQNRQYLPKSLRIDVIAIDSSQNPAEITHIKNVSA